MPKLRHLLQCLLLLAGALTLAACVRSQGTQMLAENNAKDFISTQYAVTSRTGKINEIVILDETTQGRSMPFGWGDRAEENYVLQVVGERDTLVARVQLKKTRKTDWTVTTWGVLDAADAAQYKPKIVPAQ
jgi:hypothetical protein